MHYLDNFWSIYLNCLAARVQTKKFDLIYLDISFSILTKKDIIRIVINFLSIKLDTTIIKAYFFSKKL